jgi:hypothetical protein
VYAITKIQIVYFIEINKFNNGYPTYQNNSYPPQPQPPPSSQFSMSSQSWFDPPTPSSKYNAPPTPSSQYNAFPQPPQYNAPPPQSYPSQFNQSFQQYPSQFNSPMPPSSSFSSYNQFNQQNLNSNLNYPSLATTLPTAPSSSNGIFPTLPNSVHHDQFMPQSKPTSNFQTIVR